MGKISKQFGFVKIFATVLAIQLVAASPFSNAAIKANSKAISGTSVLEDTPPPRGRKVPIDFASLDVTAGISLADLAFFEGLKLSAKYRYKVEPSYQGGYFTRIDRYKLNMAISPGDFFDVDTLPVYLKVDRGSEIIFVRQFQSQAKALISLPVFDPRRIPFTSKLAIEHMEPGDFVSIPAEMSIVVGVGTTYSLVPGLDANLGINAGVLSGKFQLHMFRLPNNQIRLRLISDKGQSIGASVGIRSSPKFFGISIADNFISRFVKADLPLLSYTRSKGSLVLLDYVYDLNRPEVRLAYDRVLKSTFRFRLRDLTLTESLRDKLLSDLLETEKIRLEDVQLPIESQRIRRLFSGDDEYLNHALQFRVGASFVNFEAGRMRAENRITYFDRFDQPKRYNYVSALSNSQAGFGWGFLKYQKNLNLSALVSNPDHGGALSELGNINLSFEVKDKYISHNQANDLINSFTHATGGGLFADNLFDSWKAADQIRDGRFLVDVWINKSGLMQIEDQSADLLFKKFTRYIDEQGLEPIYVSSSHKSPRSSQQTFTKFYRTQIRKAAERMADVLNSADLPVERARAFADLKGNMPFERMGTGFLISQLGSENLSRAILVRVRAYATGLDEISSIYGSSDNLDLLNSLQYMQYVIGNGYFDPRWDPIPDLSRRDP